MDIFLSICFVFGIFLFVYTQYFGREHDSSSDNIDKLLEREKNKDIQYNESLCTLNNEINLLKKEQTELNIVNNQLKERYLELEKDSKLEIENLNNQLLDLQEQKRKVTSQKKSSEVRLGHIAETLAPFLDQFDFDPESCVFLGKPIDYISFGDDEITLIEVKSGNSQLNSRQRHIRDQVKSKLIAWKEVRIK